MDRRSATPGLTRPAILEAVVVLAAAGVAAMTIAAGVDIGCTALVDFGLLSAIAAVSAALLFARYAAQVCLRLTSYRVFETWDRRTRTAGYAALTTYAALNAILDLTVPRRDTDAASLAAFTVASAGIVVVALALLSKHRILAERPSHSLLDSASDDAFYLALGVVTLAALLGHIVAGHWWLDTATDVVYAGVLTARVARLQRSEAT